jgi:hypothetical protein
MHGIPELYNTRDCICPVDRERLDICRNECTYKSDYPCDRDLFELCLLYINEQNWEVSTDPYAMTDLYMLLRNAIRASL